ncbi:hypothetical protein LMTR3_34660 [Bradyrhizobium sp. LMTR 3]|nr:hypothetical protein LMTR3_34660 [Bradyrhizobium sp. LMTR 3]
MTLIAEHIEGDTRDRILEVAAPPTSIASSNRRKAIHQAVAQGLMGEVELEAQRIVARPGPVRPRFRELLARSIA